MIYYLSDNYPSNEYGGLGIRLLKTNIQNEMYPRSTENTLALQCETQLFIF